MATKGITLTRAHAQEVPYRKIGAVRIKITASDPVGMDAEVFVWLRHPVNPTTGQSTDEFQQVASPYDMSTYPADEPEPTTTFPMFRTSEVELDFPSLKDANDFWIAVVSAVTQLKDGLFELDKLTVSEVVRVGDAAPSPPSDSLSNSMSTSYGG